MLLVTAWNSTHVLWWRQTEYLIFMFADRASRYIRVIKTNFMQYLSSFYFVSRPLHISDIFVAHHQEVHCIYTTTVTCCTF